MQLNSLKFSGTLYLSLRISILKMKLRGHIFGTHKIDFREILCWILVIDQLNAQILVL